MQYKFENYDRSPKPVSQQEEQEIAVELVENAGRSLWRLRVNFVELARRGPEEQDPIHGVDGDLPKGQVLWPPAANTRVFDDDLVHGFLEHTAVDNEAFDLAHAGGKALQATCGHGRR